MLRFAIILSIIYIPLAFYAFQAFKTVFKVQWAYYVYAGLFLAAWVYFMFKLMTYEPGSAMRSSMGIAGGIFFSFLLLGLFLGFFMLLEDVFRLGTYVYRKLANTAVVEGGVLPSRRKFLSAIALGIASLPFGALLYGMYKGKYNYKVLKYTLEYDDLPDAFDGYQITQISDVHSGSFDNAEKVAYGIDLINQQQSDVLLFTGDLSKLEAKDGKFSVLGNHDYGDYVSWESKEAQAKNLEDLSDFKILMSHDPSHWEKEVIDDDYHYHLTLSGHTHGMQFGLEVPGWFKISPVRLRYKYWAGIYEELGQFINVNRGFGFIGYPGRFGIWPEITVITLKKKSLT